MDFVSVSDKSFTMPTMTSAVTESWNGTNGTIGPIHHGEELSYGNIFLIALYVLVGTIGIMGNSLVCIVFGLMRSHRSQVNLFIFHQAFVDLCASILLITFGITQIYSEEIMALTVVEGANPVREVPFALMQFMCRLWWPRVFLFSMFAISTSNLTAMAIERYMAIMHPFLYATKFHRKMAFFVIAGIWLLGPVMQYFPAIYQYQADEHGHCGTQPTWTASAQAAFGVGLTTWEFFIPCFIMGFSSVSVYRALYRRTKYLGRSTTLFLRGNGDKLPTPEKSKDMVKANRNTTLVVIFVFICYVICWAPNHITFLGFNLGMYLDFNGEWYHTTVFLAFMNSCINPFIYAIRLRAFQKGLAHVCRVGCKPINSATFDSTATAAHYDVRASIIP